MDDSAKIKKLLKEADLYRSQGLFMESRDKYQAIARLVQARKTVKGREKFLEYIQARIDAVDTDIIEMEQEMAAAAARAQAEFRKLAEPSEAAQPQAPKTEEDLNQALLLVRTGRFDEAVEQLAGLLGEDALRVEAAKNIVRCYQALDDLEAAVGRFVQWQSGGVFTEAQLNAVRPLLSHMMQKKGLDVSRIAPEKAVPPKPAEAAPPENQDVPDLQDEAPVLADDAFEIDSEEFDFDQFDAFDQLQDIELPEVDAESVGDFEELDIVESVLDSRRSRRARSGGGQGGRNPSVNVGDDELSEFDVFVSEISITPTSGPNKGEPARLAVDRQSGPTLSIIVAADRADLLSDLAEGKTLDEVQCHSPISDFIGTAAVKAVRKIPSGPGAGGFRVDLEIEAS